ncbi:hypothetical protein [Symbiopectobacterium purcellii]|uniref:Secreted effector protein PipB2 N-terminal domain-containing protein n=1 Tax=Symbiopectobacterium purcellii TaxID=2871826 RepID=A0ABX9APX4_9ENTR|nr:hypothetical protein [Symbiopectobacterium purcellii]QZN97234.1 hypothetical protein K6K13_07730 [Symbiopectobacterium purcellii]
MATISQCCNMAICAAGIESEDEKNKIMSPKGVLEHIINFFTAGGIRRANERLYTKLCQSLSDNLTKESLGMLDLMPDSLTLHDIDGYSVSFFLPKANNNTGTVTVEVHKCTGKGKDSEYAKGEIRLLDYMEKCCKVILSQSDLLDPETKQKLIYGATYELEQEIIYDIAPEHRVTL